MRVTKLANIAIIVFTLVAPSLAQEPQTRNAGIRVEVLGFPDTRGRCACALYNHVDGFPTDRKQVYLNAAGKIGDDHKAVCDFKDVPTGTYAIALFHDAKLTGKMEKNLIGDPAGRLRLLQRCQASRLERTDFSGMCFPAQCVTADESDHQPTTLLGFFRANYR